MQLLLLLVCLAGIMIGTTKAASITGKETPMYAAWLDPDYTVQMGWTPMVDNVLIQLKAKTKGYISIGISPDGEMENSDILLAYFAEDGQPKMRDMFAFGLTQPKTDKTQDHTLIYGMRNDSHFVFTFSRKWKTSDKFDLDLSVNSNNIIWAMSDDEPYIDNGQFDFHYHQQNRGRSVLSLNNTSMYDTSIRDGGKVIDAWNDEDSHEGDSSSEESKET